ncbi:MAG: YkvA family protein [Leptolyngbyaceae cyanobacterium]
MENIAQSFYTWYKQTLRTPKYRWLLIAGTLLYLVSPIDIAPDFIPVIGWIDDAAIATLLIAEISQICLEFLNGRKAPTAAKDAQSADVEVISVDVS